jgi:competence protein ComEC
MLWAALAYSSGIIAGTYLLRPSTLWIAAATAFLIAGFYFLQKRNWIAAAMALIALFLAGALHIQLRGQTIPLDTSLQPFTDGQPVEITARVTREGKFRESAPNETRQTLDLQTEETVTADGTKIPLHTGIRLGIYSPHPAGSPLPGQGSPLRLFHYGERIRLPVKLKLPRNFHNPGAFDYEGYLAANGIAALGSAKGADVQSLPGFSGSRFELWRTRIHSSIVAKVHLLWPPPQAALLDAMLIGEEAFIDRDTRVDFQRSGTYHILVVSGMNVTILAFVVFWTLRRLRLPYRSGRARVARHADVLHLPWHALALPRPRNAECPGNSRTRLARFRSPATLHRQLSDDISLRPHRRRHRTSARRTHVATLSPRPRSLGFR